MDMKTFNIFHPTNGEENNTCSLIDFKYEFITSIEATTLVKSFYMSQGKLNPEYMKLGKRDTTIGDLITVDEKLYMVKGNGDFKRVPSTKTLFKEVMELDEVIIEVLSRRTLSQDDINTLIDNCF